MIDWPQWPRRAAAAAALCAVLTGCGGTVVLLPEKDGSQTALTVRQGDKDVLLDQPYAAVRTTPAGPQTYRADAQDVAAKFGPALAAQPARATTFTLYFVEGGDEFTEESRRAVDRIRLTLRVARCPMCSSWGTRTRSAAISSTMRSVSSAPRPFA